MMVVRYVWKMCFHFNIRRYAHVAIIIVTRYLRTAIHFSLSQAYLNEDRHILDCFK